MKIGGLQKLSLIDFPGLLSCIVFTQGCNFRCPYCHNPELVLPEKFSPEIDIDSFFQFLEMRKKYLEGVSITGGEPTIHSGLLLFIEKIKNMNFKVKLDTNGWNPEILKKLFEKELLDYISMDVKGPFDKYSEIAGVKVDIEKIKESIELIKEAKIPYEFKTTVVKSQISFNDFKKIGEVIKGARHYFLQKFIPTKCVNPSFLKETTYSDEEFEDIKKFMNSFVEKCEIR